MPGLDGLGLNVLGGQQLILEGGDVGDALLLEGLQAGVKGFLERGAHGKPTRRSGRDAGPCPFQGPQLEGTRVCLASCSSLLPTFS